MPCPVEPRDGLGMISKECGGLGWKWRGPETSQLCTDFSPLISSGHTAVFYVGPEVFQVKTGMFSVDCQFCNTVGQQHIVFSNHLQERGQWTRLVILT